MIPSYLTTLSGCCLLCLGGGGCAPSSAFPVTVQAIRQINATNTTRISFEEKGGYLFVTLSDKHGDGHIHIVNCEGSSKQQVLELLKQKQALLEAHR
jgi:hypothetical protein